MNQGPRNEWGLPTNDAAHSHPPGTRIAEPASKGRCWGTVDKRPGVGNLERPQSCFSRARSGRLTCNSHKALELSAQKLKAEKGEERDEQPRQPQARGEEAQ